MLTLLLIDDSQVILSVMKELLSPLQVIKEIITSSSSLKGLELVKTISPDVVLLDINMPEKNGIEVLKEIKKEHAHVKVLMVTNHATDYYKTLCHQIGADYFIDKSNEFELIPEIIESIARNSNQPAIRESNLS
ncbi:MAG: response regulator transcription factor [Bacteroidota bacterium]|nr:response regulator transcription factor [Bacteroidota bacterium]